MRPKKWKKLMKAELLGQAHVAIQSIEKNNKWAELMGSAHVENRIGPG